MVERVLARDRAILLAGIVMISVLAWAYTVREAWAMAEMHAGMDMTGVLMTAWTHQDAVLMLLMWTVMMVAMMTPSVAPTVLVYALHSRKLKQENRPYAPAGAFLAGYLLVWTGFSFLATVAQWRLQKAALLSMMMEPTSKAFAGVVLLAAGVYQWTPLKHTCLKHCRGPLSVLIQHWKPGIGGALSIGIRHGAYCAACCWFLMALLFAAGVMNLLWVAAICVFVLLEKAAPRGEILARIGGVLLAAGGLWLLAG
jgi:predicted metal-binding membrane protein